MRTLAVLLQIAGLISIFAFGVPGYVLGPVAIVAGGLLYRGEHRRRRQYAGESQPVPRRPGWQRFLIGLGAVAAGISTLIAIVWQLTAGIADTTNAFFLALKAGDMEKVHGYLAEDFRASTSDAELRRFVERSALANYESATWSSRSIENNSRGELSGTVHTANGGSIPMTVSLVKENGEWKIIALRKPDAGILQDDERSQPNPADQSRLVRETTGRFADAVVSQDFTQFRQASASLWQRQITAERLADAFKGFSAAGIDLRSLGTVDPTVGSAGFDAEGAFAIEGTYPFDGKTFSYKYRYLYEGTDWKLVGINANLR